MDGIHDLGGKEGFGKVDVNEPEEAFHAEWEARMLGIVRSMTRPDDWSLDWFRHCREMMDPSDYLTRPYYDQWMQTYSSMMVNSGVASVEEIATGRSKTAPDPAADPINAQDVAKSMNVVGTYDRPYEKAPAYAIGDRVRTARHGHKGHTRLPAYARDCIGTIHCYRGAHILPDTSSAKSEELAQPLYTVVFEAKELWGEDSPDGDRIYIDLWESYLEKP
ncbi:MAG: nitrile hydratase subunit beta [Stappiaceae bacterium]